LFLFQNSSTLAAPKSSQNDVASLINAQNDLMKRSSPEKTSKAALTSSLYSVYEVCDAIKINEGNAFSPVQKKEFFSFVETWLPWADKALKANSGALEKGVKPILENLLNDISYERLFYSNLGSVYSMYGDYSGGKPLSQPQAEMFASFLTKMADKSVMNYYQCRLLVEAMMEVVSGRSPDNWNFTFPNKGAAEFAENVLKKELPPGFKAENIIVTKTSVAFSLAQTEATDKGVNDFLSPPITVGAQNKKASPAGVQTDGVTQMPSFSRLFIIKEVKSTGYTSDKKSALGAASDQPASYMEKTMQQTVSSAVYYGNNYESDKYLSKAIAKKQVESLIYDLARRFGYTIPPDTLNAWLASKEPGKGQEFLGKLHDAKIKFNVTGSADMAVFYNGENEGVWAPAGAKNGALSGQRSSLVIECLAETNAMIQNSGADKIGFDFSVEPQAKLHVFQDFTPGQVKNLGLSKYGYKAGEGAAHMTALMTYLKLLKDAKPANLEVTKDGTISNPNKIQPIYKFKVGENTLTFTQTEKDDATKYYNKLISSGAVVLDGDGYKAGNIDLLNKYFRRMTGDPSLNGRPGAPEGMILEGKVAKSEKDVSIPANIVSRAMTESTEVPGRSVSFGYEVTARLGITTEVKGNQVIPTADYKINGVKIPFNDQNGTVETEKNGDRTVAIASTKDGSINSGYAWQTVKVEVKKPVFQIERYTSGGEVSSQYVGTYFPFPFTAYSLTKAGKDEENTTITRKPINSMLCFGVRTTDKALNYAPKYLTYPGEVVVKKDAPTYKLGNDYVVVDRDLYYRGEKFDDTKKYELYKTQSDLEKLARSGVVALFVQPATGKGAWVKLDGSLVDEKTLDGLKDLGPNEGATDVLYGPKTFAQKTVASFLNNPNYTIRADASKTGEAPNIVANEGDRYQASHLPNAIVVESKKDGWLASQHIIAKVEVDPTNPNKASVVRLDGKSIGALDISLTGKPDLAGKTRFEKKDLNMKWERANELKMQGQMGLLSECGLFLFKPREEKEGFTYLTYIPRTKNIAKVVGYIYSMPDFFKSRGVERAEE